MGRKEGTMEKIMAELEVNEEQLKEMEQNDVAKALAWCNQSGISYRQHTVVPKEAQLNILYQLIEDMEGTDGSRSFSVLATSWDKKKIQGLMQDRIKIDEYGLIAQNGILQNSENFFETNYVNGFVSYEVVDINVL